MQRSTEIDFEKIDEFMVNQLKARRKFCGEDLSRIEPFLKVKETNLRVQLEAENGFKALELAKQANSSNQMKATFEQEEKRLNRNIRPGTLDSYKIFESQLKAVLDTPIEELEEPDQQLVDPMTRQPIEVPVRNKICGHFYEKSTILQAIREQRRRCPFSSCKNEHYLEERHLEDVDPSVLQPSHQEHLE